MGYKFYAKRVLASLGLYHPSLGIKLSPEAKARIILEYKVPFKVFVETGTYKGDMVERMKGNFKKIYSVELDQEFYQTAKERFNGENHIEIIQGDSGVELENILERVKGAALFWLDAHAGGAITAGNSPIMKELEAIFKHPVKEHTILIDDARHFDMPTIRKINNLAKQNGYSFEIKDGIFRLIGSN